MKKKVCLFAAWVFLCLAVTQNVSAKIWRVNNKGIDSIGSNLGGTINNPVFNQLTNSTGALGANGNYRVKRGDTIHIEGSDIPYVGGYITKKLIIIGTGYFLTDNPATSSNILSSFFSGNSNHISFRPGSDSSQLIGISLKGSNNEIRILSNNIVIKRCRIEGTISFNESVLSDIVIIGNFFEGSRVGSAIQTDNSEGAFPLELIITNNIFSVPLILTSSSNIGTAAKCNNNTFVCRAMSDTPCIKLNAFEVKNNILKTQGALLEINSFNITHNVSSSNTGQFDTANNNIIVSDMSTIFADPNSNTPDGDYQLKSSWTSIAINKGSDGTERGAFGGTAISNHYTLSGLAPIPVIYNIVTTGVSNSAGLPVTIKTRTIQ